MAACSTLSPDATQHGADPQTSPVPYELDLYTFARSGGDGYAYTPDTGYHCKSTIH